MRAALLVVVLAAGLPVVPGGAAVLQRGEQRRPLLAVTVVAQGSSADVSTTLSEARILFDKGRPQNLSLGAAVLPPPNFVQVDGVWTTDPVFLPDGFLLKRNVVPWTSIKAIDFLDWEHAPPEGGFTRTKARISFVNGSEKECFLWNEMVTGARALYQRDLMISGRLTVAGKMQEAEFNGADSPGVLKRLLIEGQ